MTLEDFSVKVGDVFQTKSCRSICEIIEIQKYQTHVNWLDDEYGSMYWSKAEILDNIKSGIWKKVNYMKTPLYKLLTQNKNNDIIVERLTKEDN